MASSYDAVSWCLFAAGYVLEGESRKKFISRCHEITGAELLMKWNDAPGRTQAEVVALAERVEKEMGL